MIYALNLNENGRILSATYDRYALEHQPRVNHLPEGNLPDYLYIDGKFIYDPLPKPDEPDPKPTQEERIKALEEENAVLLECLLEMSEIVYA